MTLPLTSHPVSSPFFILSSSNLPAPPSSSTAPSTVILWRNPSIPIAPVSPLERAGLGAAVLGVLGAWREWEGGGERERGGGGSGKRGESGERGEIAARESGGEGEGKVEVRYRWIQEEMEMGAEGEEADVENGQRRMVLGGEGARDPHRGSG